MNVESKYALVTGASSGIGWHISNELAKRGYSIIAVSNQPEQLELLKSVLEGENDIKVETINCDLSQINAADKVFEYCKAKQLEVEVLVNNAGIYIYGEVLNASLNATNAIIQLHINTPVKLCRLYGEIMAKNRNGHILNVSSISAVMPYPTISLYGPSKTFLRKFTRAFRTEMKELGVTVLCLLPGATATALYDTNKVNVPLAMKLGVMKKPEFVARSGINALFKNRAECTPGILNKLVMVIVPLIPHALIGFIYKRTIR